MSGASAAELLGHSPRFAPKEGRSRWECRNCGRVAYQDGRDVWGTATQQECPGAPEDAEPPAVVSEEDEAFGRLMAVMTGEAR